MVVTSLPSLGHGEYNIIHIKFLTRLSYFDLALVTHQDGKRQIIHYVNLSLWSWGFRSRLLSVWAPNNCLCFTNSCKKTGLIIHQNLDFSKHVTELYKRTVRKVVLLTTDSGIYFQSKPNLSYVSPSYCRSLRIITSCRVFVDLLIIGNWNVFKKGPWKQSTTGNLELKTNFSRWQGYRH